MCILDCRNMNKVIVIFTYSRAKLLNDCFESLERCNGFDKWHLVVIHQKGDLEVELVIKNHQKFIETIIEIKSRFKKPLANINYSRIIGTKFAFEVLDADYMLGIEEDTIVSSDALDFIDFAASKYMTNRSFRGVNLGSLEPKSEHDINGYSKLRFGQHGQAGVINKRTWTYIKRKKLFELNDSVGWDSQIEFFLKSGFMVTPNVSRDLDSGWGGTHSPDDPMHPHYVAMRESWIGEIQKEKFDYKNIEIDHTWRKDAVRYRRIYAPFYLIRRSFLYPSKLLSFSKTLKKRISSKNS